MKFLLVLEFSQPILRGNDSNHIFQGGWFNHHLVPIWSDEITLANFLNAAIKNCGCFDCFSFSLKLLWEGKDLKVQYRPRQNCLEQEDGMWTLITVTMVVTPVAGVSWPQIESLRVSDANFYGKPKWSSPKIRRNKWRHIIWTKLGGGLNHVLFSPLLREMIQFGKYARKHYTLED